MFIEAKDDGSDGDNWSHKSCKAPVKSSPPTNQHQTLYRLDALPVAQPTVSKHWREKYHIPWTCLPQVPVGGLPTLYLTTNSSWLPSLQYLRCNTWLYSYNVCKSFVFHFWSICIFLQQLFVEEMPIQLLPQMKKSAKCYRKVRLLLFYHLLLLIHTLYQLIYNSIILSLLCVQKLSMEQNEDSSRLGYVCLHACHSDVIFDTYLDLETSWLNFSLVLGLGPMSWPKS